jgi:outer membrane protein TolC
MSAFTAVALALAVGLAAGEPPSTPAAQPPASPPPPAAQPPPAIVITLGEALRLASERNLDLKAAEARLRQASEATSKALAGYLPALTASGTYTRNEAGAAIPPDVLGPEEVTLVAREQLGGQVEATQVVLSPALWFGIQAASRGEEVAGLTLESVRRDILFGVAQAYYAVSALKRTREVAERLLEVALRQEKDARVRYQAGTIAKVGLLRAEIDRARAEQDLLRARNSQESVRIALATLLDRPVDFDVTDPPDPPLPPDLGSLEEAALRDRPDVRAARRSVDVARSSRNALVGAYFPDVAAFARWQVQNVAGFTGQKDAWAVGLGAQWRILDGGRREAELREANARIDEAEARAASAAAKAREDVKQALLDLESARANAAKAREQRDLAAENQRLVDVSFRAGAATAVEQADATAALRNAEIGYATEALAAQLAAVRVLKVAGITFR